MEWSATKFSIFNRQLIFLPPTLSFSCSLARCVRASHVILTIDESTWVQGKLNIWICCRVLYFNLSTSRMVCTLHWRIFLRLCTQRVTGKWTNDLANCLFNIKWRLNELFLINLLLWHMRHFFYNTIFAIYTQRCQWALIDVKIHFKYSMWPKGHDK